MQNAKWVLTISICKEKILKHYQGISCKERLGWLYVNLDTEAEEEINGRCDSLKHKLEVWILSYAQHTEQEEDPNTTE